MSLFILDVTMGCVRATANPRFLILVILLLALPLLAQENDSEPAFDSITVTETPAASDIHENAEPTAALMITLAPVDPNPVVTIELLFPDDTPVEDFMTESAEIFSSDTPAAIEVTATPMAALTQAMTPAGSFAATPSETPELIMSACKLDTDGDGEVSSTDLAALERLLLHTGVTETTAIYDLNQNGQIEIGDIQIMAGYLNDTCSE